MATAFPTTGAVQAAYRGDTAFLSSTWSGDARPDLIAVRGPYNTRAAPGAANGRLRAGSYIIVMGLVGKVALAIT
jgi:hypothetical protein